VEVQKLEWTCNSRLLPTTEHSTRSHDPEHYKITAQRRGALQSPARSTCPVVYIAVTYYKYEHWGSVVSVGNPVSYLGYP